jgi:excisionase family DNA binding protein
MAEAMYPVAEVAALWRVSRQHIYDLIAAGKLRSVQLGHGRARTRIPESAVNAYVKRGERSR